MVQGFVPADASRALLARTPAILGLTDAGEDRRLPADAHLDRARPGEIGPA